MFRIGFRIQGFRHVLKRISSCGGCNQAPTMLQYATACITQKPMIKPQIISPAPHEHLSFAATYCKLNISRTCTCKHSGFTLALQSREKRTHCGSVQSNAALFQQNFASKLQDISKISLQLKPSRR
jgi:hypothetical protein